MSKLFGFSADRNSGDFSGARASFLVRLSIRIGADAGKKHRHWGRSQSAILFLGFFEGGTYESQIDQNHIVVDVYLIGADPGSLHAQMHA
jgi:hypothetical protein